MLRPMPLAAALINTLRPGLTVIRDGSVMNGL